MFNQHFVTVPYLSEIDATIKLPHSFMEQYVPVILPPHAIVKAFGDDAQAAHPVNGDPEMAFMLESRKRIISSYSLPKAFISLIQGIFASLTLYRVSQGDQIRLYGYSAFAFTIAPYAEMSFVNLVAHLFGPQYPARYLVENTVMKEIDERYKAQTGKSDSAFEGVVGRLEEDDEAKEDFPYAKSNEKTIFVKGKDFQHYKHLNDKGRATAERPQMWVPCCPPIKPSERVGFWMILVYVHLRDTQPDSESMLTILLFIASISSYLASWELHSSPSQDSPTSNLAHKAPCSRKYSL